MSRKIIILVILIIILILYYLPEIYRTALVAFYGSTEMNATVLPTPTTVPVTPGEGRGGGEGAPGVPAVSTTIPAYKITLNLSTEILHVMIGDKTSFIATVDNVGAEKVESIRLSIEEIPLRWITSSPFWTDISPGEKQDYLVTINIPKDAEPGVYKLKVKATDEIESNTEILKLIIGRNYKEIADLLLKEVETVRIYANRSLLVENCLDITFIKTFYEDAERAYEKALEEYEYENYEESINWFEYAIPLYEKVVYKVDIAIQIEIQASNTSIITLSTLPRIFRLEISQLEKLFELAKTYLSEKDYEKICDPILRMRRVTMMSLIFWPGILAIILAIVFIVVAFIVYKKKMEHERISTLKEIEERLKSI